MKRNTLALVHTSATLVPMFTQLCKQKLPNVDTFNIADDSLVRACAAAGALTPAIARRVASHIAAAEAAGADAILVTCSSIGPAVEAAAFFTGVPLLRVDQPMADQAVRTGTRIGVIATLPTTLNPTTDLVRRRAALTNKSIEVTAQLVEYAFDALMAGDTAKHDALIATALRQLATKSDVIVLAQASMARVVDALPESDKSIPIFASPPIAIDHLAATVFKGE
jgi:Asp/Glu/hydantoin racemase